MGKKVLAFVLTFCLVLSSYGAVFAASGSDGDETSIVLADNGITVDGNAAPVTSGQAVYISNDIIYYQAGMGSSYGEGTSADEHTAAEAAAHTVVNITEPGTYRISGTLSKGQIFIDLGDNAAADPTAVVTIILDDADITCDVAPAILFYNVYECSTIQTYNGGVVDTSAAGANVIIADGSVNSVDGSYVARIYKTGTTKKLHKYDGAFYSKMSMNISGGSEGTGKLDITAENEGLDSELHLTINGGIITVNSQDDGVNTNEDYASVTTINGGTLYINGGYGAEGDGIDSNGYLTINGGNIIATANATSPDGGIDADLDIKINGGTVLALGSRNDSVSSSSQQNYMELSFSSRKAAASIITLRDSYNNSMFTYTPARTYQSVTFSSSELTLNSAYNLYVGGTMQQHSGSGSGGQGGPGGGSGSGSSQASTNFTLTSNTKSFYNITNSSNASGVVDKTEVTFKVNGSTEINDIVSGSGFSISSITAVNSSGNTVNVPAGDVQITVTDYPSEDYYGTCMLSEGYSEINNILPTDIGTYIMTVSVVGSNTSYTGSTYYIFKVTEDDDGGNGGETVVTTRAWDVFSDVNSASWYAEAVDYVYQNKLFSGTTNTTFSPDTDMSRAMFVTVLWRLEGEPSVSGTSFSDINSSSYYAEAAVWGAQNGIILGYGDGTFKPSKSISRQEMAAIMYRYAEYKGVVGSYDDSVFKTFTDRTKVSSYAQEPFKWATFNGVINGSNDKLSPSDSALRSQVAQIIMNYCQVFGT